MSGWLGPINDLLHGNRWSLGWIHILMVLVVPVILVSVADRLIRRR